RRRRRGADRRRLLIAPSRALASLLSFWLAACGGGNAANLPAPERPVATEEDTAASVPPAERLDPKARADGLFAAGRYDDALTLLETLEREEPVVRAMARAHLRRGRIDEALALLGAVRSPSFAVSVDLGE